MNQRVRLVVFDWDGTLLDSEARIVASLRSAANDVGLAVLPDATLRNVIGLGLREAIAHLYPDANAAVQHACIDRYRHHFLDADGEISVFFPGALELVQGLRRRGLYTGIATGKGRRGLDRALEEHQCASLFHASRCADETFSKPHPLMLLEIMEQMNVSPGETVMIGDTEYDMQMARNAGVAAVGVSYGVHGRERLLQHAPLACVDNVADLESWLMRYSMG